ncbi:MAG: ribonuclease PH [Candidatus Aureabacteria bacterium]|nr:ribonuclease PH [Candidatus Auribacterota bacterium]
MRTDGRKPDQIRPLAFVNSLQTKATGSVIMKMGQTVVNCSATVEKTVPSFLDPEKQGWLTCEYSMLPASGTTRVPREASRGKQSGRTMEIQRLIGRALRVTIDLKKIPGKTIWLDCDVIQADGGTRTASITGACVALRLAVKKLLQTKELTKDPLLDNVAAISLGIFRGTPLLDINYEEDSQADVDMNLVMTEKGRFVELQMSSEGNTFTRKEMDRLLALGHKGLHQLFLAQNKYLNSIING